MSAITERSPFSPGSHSFDPEFPLYRTRFSFPSIPLHPSIYLASVSWGIQLAFIVIPRSLSAKLIMSRLILCFCIALLHLVSGEKVLNCVKLYIKKVSEGMQPSAKTHSISVFNAFFLMHAQTCVKSIHRNWSLSYSWSIFLISSLYVARYSSVWF